MPKPPVDSAFFAGHPNKYAGPGHGVSPNPSLFLQPYLELAARTGGHVRIFKQDDRPAVRATLKTDFSGYSAHIQVLADFYRCILHSATIIVPYVGDICQ